MICGGKGENVKKNTGKVREFQKRNKVGTLDTAKPINSISDIFKC